MVLVDMCVSANSAAIDTELAKLGFEVVFVNTSISTKPQQLARLGESLDMTRKSSNQVQVTNRPTSRNVTREILNLIDPTTNEYTLRKLTRVTVSLQTSDKVEAVNETVLRPVRDDVRVDCFAVRPANEAQLIELINNRDLYGYDLISLDVSVGYFFQQWGVVLRQLRTTENLFIEVELGPVLNSSSATTNGVNQCRMALKHCKGMIVSSGAKSPLEVRSAVDMHTWAEGVLGLKNVQKNSERLLEKIVRKKLLRANLRKH